VIETNDQPKTSETGKQAELPAAKGPRVALWIATGFGLGYLPVAPGTWGSLGGVALARLFARLEMERLDIGGVPALEGRLDVWVIALLTLILALAGVWAARAAARYFGKTDPGQVVIDEISGQQITYLPVLPSLLFPGGWKYLVLGFVLFRVFDIVKPWPARAAEKWPHGWGIMADDWFAGAYAAAVLWLVRWSGWLGHG
jgi:phosphatidylglycerophosphatase A